jgi:hypothetical protein
VSCFPSVPHIAVQEDGMKRLLTLLSLSALLTLAPDASAQQPVPVAAIGRWDVAGQLALLNRNKADLGQRWDQWYAAPLVEGSAGHYWTPHFKTELDFATAGHGTIDGVEDMRYREHTLRESTVGATAVYQVFDNQWVHPFVGAGLEVVREHHVADSLPASIATFPITTPPVTRRPIPAIDNVSYSVRPVVTGGFKFYVSQKAFVRTEVRTAFSTDRPLAIQWRGGIGIDF